MSSRLDITRRDFLSGVALSLAAGTSLNPLELLAATDPAATYYPPALTGLRGSHPGSFEIAHAVAMGGARFDRPATQTDADYDLVVVGGGLSGLAAAYFWQQRYDSKQKILILENHDDFGGHAKRNELDVDGKRLVGFGGSEALENPGRYSDVAKQLLADIGIDIEAFYDFFDLTYYERFGLQPGVHFREAVYGRDVTTRDAFSIYQEIDGDDALAAIDAYPLSDASKDDLRRLLEDEEDHLAHLDIDDKIQLLLTTSYLDYLREHIGVSDEVAGFFRDVAVDDEDIGWDAKSAEAAWWLELPGTWGLDLGDYRAEEEYEDEPYIFHFPDGNASVARAIVQRLIPRAASGDSMEALFNTPVDYAELDLDANDTRIRLKATAVDVRNSTDSKHVEVVYVQDGEVARARGRHAVLACNHSVIPHIVSEIGDRQREALNYAERIPMVYTAIAVRNWRYLAELGLWGVYVPNAPLAQALYLDFPVSMGEYHFAAGPDDPTILRAVCMMRAPEQGLSEREQHRAGRQRLLEMSFDDHERMLMEQLEGAFGAAGFDAERDIAGITVNRWPHGYSYNYNSLFDPLDYTPEDGPHVIGRQSIGRISIANADANAITYLDSAVDAAHRAVDEQISL